MKKLKLTEAQRLLAIHLKELGMQPEFEVRFDAARKWRFDILVRARNERGQEIPGGWAFEVDGESPTGHHRGGWGKRDEHEKFNVAQTLGYKVFVFHNRTVLNGKAKAWVAKHLLLRGEE